MAARCLGHSPSHATPPARYRQAKAWSQSSSRLAVSHLPTVAPHHLVQHAGDVEHPLRCSARCVAPLLSLGAVRAHATALWCHAGLAALPRRRAPLPDGAAALENRMEPTRLSSWAALAFDTARVLQRVGEWCSPNRCLHSQEAQHIAPAPFCER